MPLAVEIFAGSGICNPQVDEEFMKLTTLRNNRNAVFIAVPFCGGALGSVFAELAPGSLSLSLSRFWFAVIQVAVWSALISIPLALALFWSDVIYRRGKLFNWKLISLSLTTGAIVGAVSGAGAQCIYSAGPASGLIKHVVLRSLCWGIMGGLLGWALSMRVPNLGAARGALGGAVGGILGGLGFVGLITIHPHFLGRLAGVGILGASLGLAIVTVEKLFRTATLAVTWGPGESSSITLGATPVTIGGGDDHVLIRGQSPKAFQLRVEAGKVFCTIQQTGQQAELNNGSTFIVGRLQFEIATRT